MTDLVGWAVMADPRREWMVGPLLEALGDMTIPVVYDDGARDRWATGRRALDAAVAQGRSRSAVIQDDAVAPNGLLAAVDRMVKHVSLDAVVSLYAGNTKRFWGRVDRQASRPPDAASWIRHPVLHWGVCSVWPTRRVAEAVDFADKVQVDNFDRRLSRWCEAAGVPVFYTWPSLVSHREHTPSLVEGRQSWGRYALRYVGADASVFDPSGPVHHIAKLR